jgi:hypothetical protein
MTTYSNRSIVWIGLWRGVVRTWCAIDSRHNIGRYVVVKDLDGFSDLLFHDLFPGAGSAGSRERLITGKGCQRISLGLWLDEKRFETRRAEGGPSLLEFGQGWVRVVWFRCQWTVLCEPIRMKSISYRYYKDVVKRDFLPPVQ